MINTTIGKYKITRLIGEGGMASVYEAEHEMLGTKVAIKVLNPILSSNAQIKERFRNEAKLMASLDHQNITKVIDFDEQPQQLSIVMEYLNGEDLNQKIKRNGPLSEKQITDVFSQTLSAFQYAHEKGIVHRDIKPSNIFILPNGHVKILDFGIAKLFGQGNEMTQTGTQMGTPIYMSPEQVKADKSIDHRSDIYSLGVTMFFAINGKPPYNSDTDSQFDIFTKIVYEGLPEFSIQSKFNQMVLKACHKNREERFQSCKDWIAMFLTNDHVKIDINDRTVLDNKDIKGQLEEANKKNIENISYTSNPYIKISSKIKFLQSLTLAQIISFCLFLLIFGLIAYNEEEARQRIFWEQDDFDYWQYDRLEFTFGAGIVSFIFIGFNLFSLIFLSKRLVLVGQSNWINIFRIITSVFMIAWSILLYSSSGGINVNEVHVAWYIYIILEIGFSSLTIRKIKSYQKSSKV